MRKAAWVSWLVLASSASACAVAGVSDGDGSVFYELDGAAVLAPPEDEPMPLLDAGSVIAIDAGVSTDSQLEPVVQLDAANQRITADATAADATAADATNAAPAIDAALSDDAALAAPSAVADLPVLDASVEQAVDASVEQVPQPEAAPPVPPAPTPEVTPAPPVEPPAPPVEPPAPPAPPTAPPAPPTAQCTTDSQCKQTCLLVGIFQCCKDDGQCGCSWAPGAYCL